MKQGSFTPDTCSQGSFTQGYLTQGNFNYGILSQIRFWRIFQENKILPSNVVSVQYLTFKGLAVSISLLRPACDRWAGHNER